MGPKTFQNCLLATLVCVLFSACATSQYVGSLSSKAVIGSTNEEGLGFGETTGLLFVHGFKAGQAVLVNDKYIGTTTASTTYFVSEGFNLPNGSQSPGWSGSAVTVRIGNGVPVAIDANAKWQVISPAASSYPTQKERKEAKRPNLDAFLARQSTVE